MSEVEYNIRPLQEEVLKIFKVFAAICDKHGLENIGWGMMVKRKFER